MHRYFTQFTSLYICIMAFFSYCDYTLSIFVYTPLYLAASYTVSLSIEKAFDAVSGRVDSQFDEFGKDELTLQLARALWIAGALTLWKYT
jgi:hypothetical protein